MDITCAFFIRYQKNAQQSSIIAYDLEKIEFFQVKIEHSKEKIITPNDPTFAQIDPKRLP